MVSQVQSQEKIQEGLKKETKLITLTIPGVKKHDMSAI